MEFELLGIKFKISNEEPFIDDEFDEKTKLFFDNTIDNSTLHDIFLVT